ncbi:MAG TPA: hypothetical protein VGF59_36545 [Bryobacteraceae bacterium]
MRAMKVALPAAILAVGMVVCTTASYGKAEYAKKEKKSCTFCHAKMTTDKEEANKNLNDAGKYYKEHNHSLDGYEKK